jgi:hypothetical protein
MKELRLVGLAKVNKPIKRIKVLGYQIKRIRVKHKHNKHKVGILKAINKVSKVNNRAANKVDSKEPAVAVADITPEHPAVVALVVVLVVVPAEEEGTPVALVIDDRIHINNNDFLAYI